MRRRHRSPRGVVLSARHDPPLEPHVRPPRASRSTSACCRTKRARGAVRRFLEVLVAAPAARRSCVSSRTAVRKAWACCRSRGPEFRSRSTSRCAKTRPQLIDALNECVIKEGGRIYLAKDAFTRAEHFRAMEPRHRGVPAHPPAVGSRAASSVAPSRCGCWTPPPENASSACPHPWSRPRCEEGRRARRDEGHGAGGRAPVRRRAATPCSCSVVTAKIWRERARPRGARRARRGSVGTAICDLERPEGFAAALDAAEASARRPRYRGRDRRRCSRRRTGSRRTPSSRGGCSPSTSPTPSCSASRRGGGCSPVAAARCACSARSRASAGASPSSSTAPRRPGSRVTWKGWTTSFAARGCARSA